MHKVHRTTARPASFPEYASSSSDEDFDSEHDEETRRRQAFRAGPTVTVHTPQGPQQLATMDYTQLVALKAFLKNKGLSQAGRKADLIARLKHYQEEKIKSTEDGTDVHPSLGQRPKPPSAAASSSEAPSHDGLVCRYGVECRREECIFKHPDGRRNFPADNIVTATASPDQPPPPRPR